MPLSPSAPRRVATGAVLLGGLLSATLFGGVASASANEDPAANPPNCSAADLEGVRAGVSASTAAYLFTHPDLNTFETSLEGLQRDEVSTQLQAYLTEHPQEQSEITGIRQPLVDLKNRCGG